MIAKLFLMILVLIGLLSCSKTTVVLLESGKQKNAILIANEKGTMKLDRVGNYVDLKAKDSMPTTIGKMSKDELQERFADVLAIAPLKPLTYILYFKSNSTALTEASKKTLKKALKVMQARSPCMVDIIGHTDTVGSHAVNVQVSLQRAKSIASFVKQTNIKLVSLVAKGYGEEDLLVKTQNNKAESRNRNVEIFIK